MSNTALTLLLWVKVLFSPKKCCFLQKNTDISKITRTLVLKGNFLKLILCVYLRTKFQVSSIILTSFRSGGHFNPPPPPLPPTPQNGPRKSPPRLGLKIFLNLSINTVRSLLWDRYILHFLGRQCRQHSASFCQTLHQFLFKWKIHDCECSTSIESLLFSHFW